MLVLSKRSVFDTNEQVLISWCSFSFLCGARCTLGASTKNVSRNVYRDTRHLPAGDQHIWLEVIGGQPRPYIWDRPQKTSVTSAINGGKILFKLLENHRNRWAASWQNQQNECSPSEDADQPGHPPSLIRVFVVRSVDKDPSFLHADSEDSDQTGRMSRLVWVFAGHTATLLVLSCRGSGKVAIWWQFRNNFP